MSDPGCRSQPAHTLGNGREGADALDAWLEQPGNSQTALASAIKVTQGAISQWLANGEIPVKRVPDVARVTGISKATLRPDYFGEDAAP